MFVVGFLSKLLKLWKEWILCLIAKLRVRTGVGLIQGLPQSQAHSCVPVDKKFHTNDSFERTFVNKLSMEGQKY